MALQKTEYQILVINRVKQLRVTRNVSQQQLASILDATNGTIGNIESLKYANKYTFSQLNTLAHFFQVPIDTFFRSESEDSLPVDVFADRVCEYLEGFSQ